MECMSQEAAAAGNGARSAPRRGDRAPDGEAPAARPPSGRQSLVVIGNGMAGYKLCERLVAGGASGKHRITIFGEEPRPAYDRVHLTQVLAGKSPDQLSLAPAGWYADNSLELCTGDPVVAVDRERKVVRSAAGREVAYDRLVFATGSRAFLPAIEGRDLPGVLVYRTLADLEQILAAARTARRVAILGGGLLGLEAAKAIRDLGPETWIIERGSGLLARQLDPEGSRLLQTHVEKLGLHVLTGRETERIEALTGDRLLTFNTGEALRVQLVVVSVGIRPRDELAAACGLRLGRRGGIEVDDSLQSSDPAIFAIGECAAHRGTLYGLAGPGFLMAETLAANLAGRRRRFSGADPSTWLKLAGISVATLGDYQAAQGESLVSRPDRGYRRLIVENGRLVGAVAIGDWPEQARIHGAIQSRRRVWRWERRRFLAHGCLWSDRAPKPVSEWPEAALVCNCLGVRRGTLSTACAQGCATVEQLAQATGASTVCGSCKPLLAQFVGAPAVTGALPGAKWLLAGAVLALVLTGGIALLPRLELADSVQGGWRPDSLWRDSFNRKFTGFTLLGLAVVSLLLSARKRLARFSWGEVGTWRAVHAALGTLSLLALVTHTGFRLGQNLNLVLMLNFLALALLGALAAGVTALEHRLAGGPGARRIRALWTGAHVALAWPLPVLVGFHVLSAYYF